MDIFPLMCAAYKVWISELTLIHTNIRSVCNSHAQVYRSIWCKTHYDITDNNNNISSESLYRRYHKYQLVLVIMSVSTFIIIPPLIEWGLYCNHLVRPSVHTFVTDISASTGRNDFIFDIWLWHGDLYRVAPFQVYRSSISRATYKWTSGVFLARRSVQHLVSITNFRAGENCKLSLIRNKNRNYNYFLFTLLQEKNEMSANDI